jgi:hypothetical protein
MQEMVKIQSHIFYSTLSCFRPNLSSIIPNLIYGIKSQVGLSEEYSLRYQDEIKKLVDQHTLQLDLDNSACLAGKTTKLCNFGQDLGFFFRESNNKIHHVLLETFHNNGDNGSQAEEERPSYFDPECKHWATMKKNY